MMECAALDRQQLPDSVQILHISPVETRRFGSYTAVGPQSPCWVNSLLASRLQLSIGEGARNMLWTICLVLLVLWALGMATSYTAGGLIHILLVVGLIVLVFRLIQGRRIFG
jgi:hypothetical protein